LRANVLFAAIVSAALVLGGHIRAERTRHTRI
jgi:hypothetical protein